jgi:Zn-dependent peptidase ImmA (M78 family)
MDSWRLAQHLDIKVKTTAQFPGLEAEDRMLLEADDSWSAVTLEVKGKKLVILKDSNSPGRKSSDLTHELAHQLLGHQATGVGVSMAGHLLVHAFSREEEDQANWLSGCLLLPRTALIHIRKKFVEDVAAARAYTVSVAMLKYRLGVTGVNHQLRRAGL